jgi:hypothetical protein
MKPLWRRVALFLVVLACASGVLVTAGLEDERPEGDVTASAP